MGFVLAGCVRARVKCSVAGQNRAPPRWEESNQMRNKEKQTKLVHGEVLNHLMVSVQHFVNKLTLLQRVILEEE